MVMSVGAVTLTHPPCLLSAATRPSRFVTGPGCNPSLLWQASENTATGRLNVMTPMSSLRIAASSIETRQPSPTVTKIRGVGDPATSSTKYVPGTNRSSSVPNSARGGTAGGTVTVGDGWSAGVTGSSL